MTAREVFEQSKGMPWADPLLRWEDTRFMYDGNRDGWPKNCHTSLAEAAMMRGMVEWLLNSSREVAMERMSASHNLVAVEDMRGHNTDTLLESLLLACQSLYNGRKEGGEWVMTR